MKNFILLSLLFIFTSISELYTQNSDSVIVTHRSNYFLQLNSDQIAHFPIRNFDDLIRLHPSVIIQDGNVYIRGGRDDENGYMIDGAWATNPMDNSNGIYVIPEMIEQIDLYKPDFVINGIWDLLDILKK